jgi:membrane associated rhomboid family serine protease
MWFLWIFGDNVEDALGHARYLGFYLGGGVAAALVQVLTNLTATAPMVGASGAIAAVTGAYLVLYPRAPILILNPVPLLWLFWGITLIVPAWIVAGEFFVMNAYMGFQSLQVADHASEGGVAVFAHLGGFIAGLIAITPLTRGRDRPITDTWNGWQPPARNGRGYNGRP